MEIFTLISFAVCLFAIPVIIGVAIFLIIRRGMQMKNLAHHGVPTTGKILLIKQLASANRSPQSRSWRLRYSYTVEGRTFENGINPGTEERQLAVGGPIEIVYLPTDPSVSATRNMVNLSRQALKLPPLL